MRTEIAIAAQAEERPVDWEAAYQRYAPRLMRYLRRLSSDPTTAEDLMHETFERAFRAKRTPSEGGLQPWLYRIATNLATDQLRRSRRLRFVPFSGVERARSSAFDPDADAVRRALRSIAPEQAVALVLRLHEGFSRVEIAELTGVPERAVKERLARGRDSFAEAYRREAAPR